MVCDAWRVHSDGAAYAVMVADRRPLQRRHVARTVVTAALITSYVVAVVQASDCDVDEYYDDLGDECRSCELLCNPVYGTAALCAERCPAYAGMATQRYVCRLHLTVA